jgi:hypothetical protein
MKLEWGYMRVFTNDHLTVTESKQTFIPRSKKRRIVKKCKKRYTIHYQVPDPNVYILNEKDIHCHPSIASKLREIMTERR